MKKELASVVGKSLVSWIVSQNRWLQLLLVVTALLAVFANVLPLEMQKRIVNDAINLKKFDMLVIYCTIYLAAVAAASILKYSINILQNIIGQRAIADMRQALYARVLTVPLGFYRKTQPGLVVAALTTELATAGDFVGMAIAVPLTNLLMLLAFGGYLFWLNPLLAAITLSIYPVVLLLVPVLQKRVNFYNRKRVDAGRRVSGKIGETIAGIHEIQANGAFSIENEKFKRLVDHLREIRIIWNLYRFGIKAVNSLFTNFSRFLVFAIGGYLAINGRLELGALVAFLSAQDKLYDPWKELIQFYQAYQTASVTYSRTMSYFDVPLEHSMVAVGRPAHELEGRIEVRDLSFAVPDGTRLLSDINFDLKQGEHMALVGFSGSGKSTLVQCIAQLYQYSGGRIRIDKKEISQLSKTDIVNNIGFVSQAPFIFDGSVEENLVYAVLAKAEQEPAADQPQMPGLDDRILVLQQTGLFADVLRFGLNMVLDKNRHEDLSQEILKVRKIFRHDFGEDLAELIEFYNADKYLYTSSVADNIMFGEPLDDLFSAENLPQNKIFGEFVVETGLSEPLLESGLSLAEDLIKFSDQQTSDEEILALDFIQPGEIDDLKRLCHSAQKKGIPKISRSARCQILGLILNFTPAKHPFFQLPKPLEDEILEKRALFKEKLSVAAPDAVSFYRMSDYMFTQSILTNIFFGKLKAESATAREKVNTCIHQLLIREDYLEDIIEMGMQFQVGTKGNNLSGGQRQKLAIARMLIKKPPVMIMDEATSGLDNESQARIQDLLETHWKGKSTLIAVVHRLDIIKNYDQVAVMKAGKIVEMGSYEELMKKSGTLHELVSHDR